jgi:cytoskeletal protein CcmA (bactofilin family)
MKFELPYLTVPETVDEVEKFDWANFPPALANRKSNFFLIVDEATGIKGKLVTWTTFIHGQVDGLVFAEHVTVEQSGSVKGVIFCRTLQVMGTVNASVIAEAVHIRDHGVLNGVVKHKSLKVDTEGLVTGSFERRGGGDGGEAEAVPEARSTYFSRPQAKRRPG